MWARLVTQLEIAQDVAWRMTPNEYWLLTGELEQCRRAMDKHADYRRAHGYEPPTIGEAQEIKGHLERMRLAHDGNS